MKFRKLSSLFLAGTIGLTTVLTGCTSSNSNSEVKGDSANGDNTQLVWYMIGTPQPDQAKVMEKVNEYTAEKIGVTLDLRMIDWGDYGQKMQVMASSGEPFDICFANDYSVNAQKGYYLEITDELLDTYGKDLKEAINPLFLEGASINGKLYGIPANKEVGQQMVWAFNKEMLDKYGLDIENVSSLESLEPLLEKVKAEDPNLKMPISAGANFVPYLPFDLVLGENLPIGISVEGDTNKVVNVYETEEVKSTINTLRKYYQKGYIHAQAATDTDPHEMSVQNWFLRKEHYAPGGNEMWSNSAGFEIVSAPVHDPITKNESVTGSVMAISATSQNPEKAMEFLNLLNTDEYLRNLVDRGIEGEHYTKNDDGTITATEKKNSGYNMPSWALGNVFVRYPYDNEPKDIMQQYEDFNSKSTASPALGFYPDTSSLTNEVAALTNVVQEFRGPLLTGSVDPEKYLADFNKKLKSAGVDKVIEEVQKQYDEWKANNK